MVKPLKVSFTSEHVLPQTVFDVFTERPRDWFPELITDFIIANCFLFSVSRKRNQRTATLLCNWPSSNKPKSFLSKAIIWVQKHRKTIIVNFIYHYRASVGEMPFYTRSLWVSGITSRATESYFTSFLSVAVHFNIQNTVDLLEYSKWFAHMQ